MKSKYEVIRSLFISDFEEFQVTIPAFKMGNYKTLKEGEQLSIPQLLLLKDNLVLHKDSKLKRISDISVKNFNLIFWQLNNMELFTVFVVFLYTHVGIVPVCIRFQL